MINYYREIKLISLLIWQYSLFKTRRTQCYRRVRNCDVKFTNTNVTQYVWGNKTTVSACKFCTSAAATAGITYSFPQTRETNYPSCTCNSHRPCRYTIPIIAPWNNKASICSCFASWPPSPCNTSYSTWTWRSLSRGSRWLSCTVEKIAPCPRPLGWKSIRWSTWSSPWSTCRTRGTSFYTRPRPGGTRSCTTVNTASCLPAAICRTDYHIFCSHKRRRVNVPICSSGSSSRTKTLSWKDLCIWRRCPTKSLSCLLKKIGGGGINMCETITVTYPRLCCWAITKPLLANDD